MPKHSWSFTALKDFKGCARRYHANKVLKLYPFEETEAIKYGNLVHKACEEYIRDGKPLPQGMEQFQPMLDALNAIPGKKICEQKMAVREDFTPCGYFDKKVWCRGAADLIIINGDTAFVVDYKGLALDTELPTPAGFTTMRDVKVGDILFSESGAQCRVVGKSEVKNLPCFKVTFDDGTSVVCDEEHLWKLHTGDVVAVKSLRTTRWRESYGGRSKVSTAGALVLPHADLGISPYVLGLWIADGKHTSGEISKPDSFIWGEIQREGYSVNMETGGKKSCPTRTVGGLVTQLRTAGLIGNKHIPKEYLRASADQRLALLQGLMDGDGSANRTRKRCLYTTTDHALALQVHELLSSLGQKASLSKVKQTGFGKTVFAYWVHFTPSGIMPFRLPRKAAKITSEWGAGQSRTRKVMSVEEVPSVPTQCIAVDSDDRTYLCTRAMIPTHNTGGAKYPDKDQLHLMALMVFEHYPEVQTVKAALAFIVHDVFIKAKYKRENRDKMWAKWVTDTDDLEAAFEGNVWHPNPSPLCGWCNHEACEHYTRR